MAKCRTELTEIKTEVLELINDNRSIKGAQQQLYDELIDTQKGVETCSTQNKKAAEYLTEIRQSLKDQNSALGKIHQIMSNLEFQRRHGKGTISDIETPPASQYQAGMFKATGEQAPTLLTPPQLFAAPFSSAPESFRLPTAMDFSNVKSEVPQRLPYYIAPLRKSSKKNPKQPDDSDEENMHEIFEDFSDDILQQLKDLSLEDKISEELPEPPNDFLSEDPKEENHSELSDDLNFKIPQWNTKKKVTISPEHFQAEHVRVKEFKSDTIYS